MLRFSFRDYARSESEGDDPDGRNVDERRTGRTDAGAAEIAWEEARDDADGRDGGAMTQMTNWTRNINLTLNIGLRVSGLSFGFSGSPCSKSVP